MAWIIFTAVLIVAVFVWLRIRESVPPPQRMMGWGIVGFLGMFYIIMTATTVFATVDNGHVGIVTSFGAIVGKRGDGHGGVVMVLPWQNVQEANVQIQKVLPQDECTNGDITLPNCLEAFSSETQPVFIQPSINVHVDPKNIESLYRDVGPDYINKIVLPNVAQIMKDEVSKYSATDVAPNREQLRRNIASRLTTELSTRSIIVDDFLLTNISFTPAFSQAIDQKVTAEQNAVTEQNKVAVAKAQADQQVATAQGEADATVAKAKGQAEANKLLSESLTPELIQFTMVQNLSDNITVVGIPVGQGTIFDMSQFLTPAPTP